MSDLQARLVAAIQSIRTSTPRECDEWCETIADSGFDGLVSHSNACVERWAARVDARLAACVEASWHVAIARCIENVATGDYVPPKKAPAIDAGLAAFLVAAAQKETT